MTRPAQRILERARASAWRRVGIPAVWSRPVPPRDEETGPETAVPVAGAPDSEDEGGKNVAAENGADPGTGRRDGGANAVSHDSTEP